MASKWKKVNPVEDWRTLPNTPGCYVVFANGNPIYVGQTTNLQKRIKSYEFNYAHYSNSIHTPWGICNDLFIKFREPKRFGDWAMIELRLIKRLQPKFNCVGSIKNRNQIFDRWSSVDDQ